LNFIFLNKQEISLPLLISVFVSIDPSGQECNSVAVLLQIKVSVCRKLSKQNAV